MGTKIKPIGRNVLIKPRKHEDVTKGGIIIPQTVTDIPQDGEVIEVGTKSKYKPGDNVMFGKFRGTTLQWNEEEYLLLDDIYVVGLLKN